jgi:hypothetical protein
MTHNYIYGPAAFPEGPNVGLGIFEPNISCGLLGVS